MNDDQYEINQEVVEIIDLYLNENRFINLLDFITYIDHSDYFDETDFGWEIFISEFCQDDWSESSINEAHRVLKRGVIKEPCEIYFKDKTMKQVVRKTMDLIELEDLYIPFNLIAQAFGLRLKEG